MITLLWIHMLGVLVVMVLIAVVNAFTFPRLSRQNPEITPSVSILIPARNEAQVIGNTINKLLAQTYPNYELIVLDDQSTDGTGEVAYRSGGADVRLSIIRGEPLPPGWLGKNWACHQLTRHARGEIFVFTDADVSWEPEALAALMAAYERLGAPVLTVWPTQTTKTWAERLIVPLIMLTIVGYLPEVLVRFTHSPLFTAANGQCLLFQRDAYRQVGGHAAIRSCIIEDMALAKRTRQVRLLQVMLLGTDLIQARMYHDWASVRDGFAKNILAGHGNRPVFLLLSTVFHWTIFIIPWIWLFAGIFIPAAGWPFWPLSMVLLGVGLRAFTALVSRQRLVDALLLPVSVFLMTLIAGRSLWWHFRLGGPRWKERQIVLKGG